MKRTQAESPLDAAEFSDLMAALGPFERAPRLAVAVSGGADSMALLLLARDWAVARNGSVTALTVDHGLRPAAAAEARRVGLWAAAMGVAHETLAWTGNKPRGDIQAAARAARYRLLERWCDATATFHLLLAHHREDQAETFLLRLARGSGLDGLAAVAPVVERPACRLLRPLLTIPRARLRTTLRRCGQPWLEDPSNDNRAFARVRLRQSAAILAREGLSPDRLAATARRLARARQALEQPLARLLARIATPDPAGFVRLDPRPLRDAPDELGLRALAAIVTAVGGGEHGPRLERLERLYGDIARGPIRGRTLAGCRIVPDHGAVLICREPAALAPAVLLQRGKTAEWDGRFRLSGAATMPLGWRLGGLGAAKLAGAGRALPAAARGGIAAVIDDKGVVAAPAIGYARPGAGNLAWARDSLLLRTTRPATGAGVKVA